MLVLDRYIGESILIGDDIKVIVAEQPKAGRRK